MATHSTTFRRNLFEIENARNLTRDELVATFVPTQAFWRLLSAKNHVILGSRGSGKTAMAKMLSHDHLSRLKEGKAQEIISTKSFVGTYVPTRLEWVGGLKNKPWQTELEKELFFQWRLNLSTCLAFLATLRSCLETYVPSRAKRARLEEALTSDIAASWSGGVTQCRSLRDLHYYLEDIEHRKQQQFARQRAVGKLRDGELPEGLEFEADLFSPLRRAITLTGRALSFPDQCSWLLCLDEAEFLELSHHRILNSHLRSHSGNLAFKITTMPFFHHTLETNAGVPLDVGHDFEYVYIDQDPILLASQGSSEENLFAGQIFQKRAVASFSRRRSVTLSKLLGDSPLLDPKPDENWAPGSENFALLRKHASDETVERAQRLSDDLPRFQDQLVRKIRGALILREAVTSQSGREELEVYSGARMGIRCGDANPRRLIRIYNSLLLETRWERTDRAIVARLLSGRAQTRILTKFSTSTLSRVQSEPQLGPQLFELLFALGTYMRHCLHEEPLTTDQVTSVTLSVNTDPGKWALVRRAVGLGLLFPNVGAHNPDQMPERDGTFHLAYVLAPHFRLLPRRGKSRKLETVLSFWQAHKTSTRTNPAQQLLFPQTEEGMQ